MPSWPEVDATTGSLQPIGFPTLMRGDRSTRFVDLFSSLAKSNREKHVHIFRMLKTGILNVECFPTLGLSSTPVAPTLTTHHQDRSYGTFWAPWNICAFSAQTRVLQSIELLQRATFFWFYVQDLNPRKTDKTNAHTPSQALPPHCQLLLVSSNVVEIPQMFIAFPRDTPSSARTFSK